MPRRSRPEPGAAADSAPWQVAPGLAARDRLGPRPATASVYAITSRRSQAVRTAGPYQTPVAPCGSATPDAGEHVELATPDIKFDEEIPLPEPQARPDAHLSVRPLGRRLRGRCGRGSRCRMWRRRRSPAASPAISSRSMRTCRGGGPRSCAKFSRTRRRVRGAGPVRAVSVRIPRCRGGCIGGRTRWCSSRSSSAPRRMSASTPPAPGLSMVRRLGRWRRCRGWSGGRVSAGDGRGLGAGEACWVRMTVPVTRAPEDGRLVVDPGLLTGTTGNEVGDR